MNTKSKIIPKHRLVSGRGERKRLDSVRWIKDRNRAEDVLYQAKLCWDALEGFRRERERCLRYTYGDQWGDNDKRDRNL